MTINDRVHFFALAARLMRQILVDHARRRLADKRGGSAAINRADHEPPAPPAIVDVLDLDAALEELTTLDERASRVVELKFFAGLSIEETAAALEASAVTVERDSAVAKAWLLTRPSPPTQRK